MEETTADIYNVTLPVVEGLLNVSPVESCGMSSRSISCLCLSVFARLSVSLPPFRSSTVPPLFLLLTPYHIAVSNFNLKGYNGTILAYGQTGSGKTFTMQGSGDIEKTNADKSSKNVEDIGAKNEYVRAEYSLKLKGI